MRPALLLLMLTAMPAAAASPPPGPVPTAVQDGPPVKTAAPLPTASPPAVPPTATAESDWTAKDWTLLLGQCLTAIVAGAALIVSVRNTRSTIDGAKETAQAQRWRDANGAELQRLQSLIQNFHVPYKVLAQANFNMASDLRARLDVPDFRLLTSLFKPGWLASLPTGDQVLVKEICRNGRRLQAFIERQGGEVDPMLTAHLGRAVAHFRILWLAYKGDLGTDAAPFTRYVYPRALDAAIDADLERIGAHCARLRAQPSVEHGCLPPLELQPEATLEAWPNPARAKVE